LSVLDKKTKSKKEIREEIDEPEAESYSRSYKPCGAGCAAPKGIKMGGKNYEEKIVVRFACWSNVVVSGSMWWNYG